MSFNRDMLTRQSDLIPEKELGLDIDIIGCGGLGSTTAVFLARMGLHNMRLWDFDTVSVENLSSQHFTKLHLEVNKAYSVSQQILEITGLMTEYKAEKYINDTLSRVVISAVDSMEVRENIYKQAVQSNTQWLIDPRMGAETGAIYVVDLYDERARGKYENSLYSDEDAVQEVCTAKATGYCALEISAKIVKMIKDIMVGRPPIKMWSGNLDVNYQKTWYRDEQP